MVLRKVEGILLPNERSVLVFRVPLTAVAAVIIIRQYIYRFAGREPAGSLPSLALFHHSTVLSEHLLLLLVL